MWNKKFIVQIKMGSHLYGTSTPNSDLDIKGIFLPSARDIVLQQITPVINVTREKEHGEKNKKEDIDKQAYSLQNYLQLLAQGQMGALDMLYAPQWAMIDTPHPLWSQICDFAPQILTSNANNFLKYCHKQADKYGIKGSRIATLQATLQLINNAIMHNNMQTKLIAIYSELEILAGEHQLLEFNTRVNDNGNTTKFFTVCGKKLPMSSSLANAKALVEGLISHYSQRTIDAAKNEGIDWKALSHAVRVGHQALEFLKTGQITFPRPEAQHLLAIKSAKLTYKEIAGEIEQLLLDIQNTATISCLPNKIADRPLIIDNFVAQIHTNVVKESYE